MRPKIAGCVGIAYRVQVEGRCERTDTYQAVVGDHHAIERWLRRCERSGWPAALLG
ncbi:MAG: hypothetical protein IPM36_04405 [Lewinellaceae bacterium]|nr:hypothetical protein [Lewinellaceae bacterium]